MRPPKMKPDIPTEVRAAVLKRANGHCEGHCGYVGPLEVHHTTYGDRDSYGEQTFNLLGHEEPDDLLALCRDCHRDQHVDPYGDFHADPEDCEAEWDYYDHMTSKND
jgi:5-methylcytosine-specific restriction endonuclease McrA